VSNLESLSVESTVEAPAMGRPSAAPSSGSRGKAATLARDLVALTKPRITLLVLITGAAGMWVAPHGPGASGAGTGGVKPATMFLSLVATALIVGSANALNMWWERDLDGKMARTKSRPLPAGRMNADLALAFGLALGVVSTPMLFAVNVATGVLGLVALVSYVAIYTPLKKKTWPALLVGAIPGAMPPLMGWTTVTGRLDVGGLLLFGVLFLWQVPHFSAISLFRRDDYANAGLKVVSVDRGEAGAKRVIVQYTALLVANSLLLFPFGVGGVKYFGVAAVLGAVFMVLGVRGAKNGGDRWAKRVFAYSIVYLLALLTALLLDRAAA